jgi:threonine dehydrogenase-like Zn-dependent dehydrogenase
VPNSNYTFANLGKYVFSGFDDVITGLSLESNSPKFDGSVVDNFSFTAHSITIDFSAAKAQNNNASLVLNIATAGASAQGSDVPEPGSVAIIGLGLLGLAASRRKFAKRDAA